ncbi:MAG: AtpZ/AtpI family protein [Acidimicrobiia bacterium]
MPTNNRPTELTENALHSTGAYELVFSALLLGLLGYGIDRWLGTSPFFVVLFAFLGFLGASASLYYRFQFKMSELSEDQ